MREAGGTLEPTRLKKNMLSSMPVCFNLFGALRGEPGLLELIRTTLDPEATSIVRVDCEWAPPPAEALSDKTAFDAVTTRWTKYGKDRLYVKTPDGTEVGHIDLLTGAVEVQVAEFDSEVRALAPQRKPRPVEPTLSLLPSPTVPIELTRAPLAELLNAPPSTSLPTPAGFDLANNAAGAAARAKRQEINGQAPVWNLVARALGV